jgi:2-aminoadipate transaminase
MMTGRYSRHVEMLRERYRRKRDLMLQCIGENLPSEVEVIKPGGGMYVWATLPGNVDTGCEGKLFNEARRTKVLYVPGEFCYCSEPGVEKPTNKLRISFGMVTEKNIIEGMARLGEAVSRVLG